MKNLFAKTLILIAVVTTACFCASAQTTEKFEPNGGTFYVSSDSRATKALKSFVGMALTTVAFKNDGRTVPVKPQGVVYEENDRQFKMTKIVFDGESFSFETLPRGGVSYKFSGKILHPSESNRDGQTIVLQGHLTKFTNGKKIAEADLRFQFEEGD